MGSRGILTTEQKAEALQLLETGMPQKEIAEKFGVRRNIISCLYINNKRKKADESPKDISELMGKVKECQNCKTKKITELETEVKRLQNIVIQQGGEIAVLNDKPMIDLEKRCMDCEKDFGERLTDILRDCRTAENIAAVRAGVIDNLHNEIESLQTEVDLLKGNAKELRDNEIIELNKQIAKNAVIDITDPENVVKFQSLTDLMTKTYREKNKKYGNSFSKTYKEYGAAVLCIRLEDKLSRVKQMLLRGETGTADESVIDTLIDLANYSIMAIMEIGEVNPYEI